MAVSTGRPLSVRALRPIWSRQHGATILLGVSWLITTASTPRFHPAQLALLARWP